jgi:IS4 transposase
MNETAFLSHYIVLATTLSPEISCEEVLEIYRFRWQVELVLKRLKSILDFGELPKKSEKSSLAWLNAKLMVALLFEGFTASACFSP